jgi:WD40 repeat protein
LYLAVLSDNTLASGSVDKTIRIWDTVNGILLKILNGHTDYIHALAVLPNNTLASGSNDKTIKIWE